MIVGDRIMSILRTTALLLDPVAAAASQSADRQPIIASRMKVTVEGGTTGSGTVTIAGTVDGSPDSETITFTVNSVLVGIKEFTAIDPSGITTTGLADEVTVPTLSIQAVDSGGQVQNNRIALTNAQGIGATLSFRSSGGGGSGAGDWFIDRHGQHVDEQALIQIDFAESFTPRRGDLIVDDDTLSDESWIIRAVRLTPNPLIPHHFELTCSRFQNEA